MVRGALLSYGPMPSACRERGCSFTSYGESVIDMTTLLVHESEPRSEFRLQPVMARDYDAVIQQALDEWGEFIHGEPEMQQALPSPALGAVTDA